MADEKKMVARRGPELVEVGTRMISSGGWSVPLLEEHLRVHLGQGLSQRWCSVGCLARTFFGRNTPAHREAVRHRLSRAFRLLLLRRDLFLVIEYEQGKGTHGAAVACKLLQTENELERQHARVTLKRMRGNKVKTAEALGISRATLYRLLEEEEKD